MFSKGPRQLSIKPTHSLPQIVRATLLSASLLPAAVFASPLESGQGFNERVPAPQIERMLRLAEDIMASNLPIDDALALTPPPSEPLRTPTSWLQLSATVDWLDEVLDDASISHGLRLNAAQVNAKRALHHLLDQEPNFQAALRHLLNAVAAIEHRNTSAVEQEALQRFADAGELLAQESLVRAQSAELDREIIAAMEADIEQGARLVAAGNYKGGMGFWIPVLDAGDIPVFDIETFAQGIQLALDGETVGYAYAISQNGQYHSTFASGQARTVIDLPEIKQSATKEMNIASVSKTITATAMMQLLSANNLTVDDPISPWLPPHWAQGPGIEDLTFRHLLTHRSGLNNNQGGKYEYDDLQSYIAAGVTGPKTHEYQNTNFALFRVMIPYLWEPTAPQDSFFLAILFSLLPKDLATAVAYITYVQTAVLEPMSISANCVPSDAHPTLLYRLGDDQAGYKNGDWSLKCGSGGWYASARELAAFLAHQRYDNSILTPAERQAMDFGFLGWNDPEEYSWTNGQHGIYRSHGGDLFYNPSPRRGMDSCIMSFPLGVQVALLINSNGGNYGGNSSYQCTVLRDAYDNAWM